MQEYFNQMKFYNIWFSGIYIKTSSLLCTCRAASSQTWPLLLPRVLHHAAGAASDKELHHAALHAQPDAPGDVEQDRLGGRYLCWRKTDVDFYRALFLVYKQALPELLIVSNSDLKDNLDDEEEWDPEVVTVVKRSPCMGVTGAETLGLVIFMIKWITP